MKKKLLKILLLSFLILPVLSKAQMPHYKDIRWRGAGETEIDFFLDWSEHTFEKYVTSEEGKLLILKGSFTYNGDAFIFFFDTGEKMVAQIEKYCCYSIWLHNPKTGTTHKYDRPFFETRNCPVVDLGCL